MRDSTTAPDELARLIAAARTQPGGVERSSGMIKFQCAACHEDGHDAHHDNACLFVDSGKWGCAFAKDTPDGPRHWSAIGRALGAFEHGRPAPAPPPSSPAPPEAAPLVVPPIGVIGLGRDFAALLASYVEAPLAFFYFLFLAYFGAAVARKITLASAIRPQPRLFPVVLGESADSRKSTAERMTRAFFRGLAPSWDVPTMLGVGSGEGLAAELQEQPDLVLAFDEFKAFVDKAKVEGSILLPLVGSLFEGGDYDGRTKKERVTVRDAALTLVACSTLDTYAQMFDRHFFNIGFLNRLWLVADRPTQAVPVPRDIPEEALAPLRARVTDALRRIDRAFTANGAQAVAYPMTPGADAIFAEWYLAREASVFGKRLDTYGHRLMLLLAATTGREVIDHAVAEATVALLRWQLEVRRDVDPVDADNAVAAMEIRIRRSLARGALRERDLQRKCHYERSGIWVFQTAIANLTTAKEVVADRARGTFTLAGVPTFVPTYPEGGNPQ